MGGTKTDIRLCLFYAYIFIFVYAGDKHGYALEINKLIWYCDLYWWHFVKKEKIFYLNKFKYPK